MPDADDGVAVPDSEAVGGIGSFVSIDQSKAADIDVRKC
jgi:hypothetical protein